MDGDRRKKDVLVLAHAQQSCLQQFVMFAQIESVWQIMYVTTRLKNILFFEGVTP